ncbi:MAG TPA: hypothetical protein VKX49_06900 [Bryobacteraceae bacterium]|nr:hypothetical protein [Bryobacteraceae bacterium]
MKFTLAASCGLMLFVVAAHAQSPVMNPPININIPALGVPQFYADTISCPSVKATVSIADPSIVSVTPTSATFTTGNAQFTLIGLKNGKTVVTITFNVSGSPCMTEQIIQPLNVTVAGTQPSSSPITGLANNYSFIAAGLPNYGIAQGSIFDIFGTNLSPTSTPLQSVPLKTNLGGVTVTVTVNGTTTNVILYYVTPTQIAGILPSSTPVGSGTLSVFNNGTLIGTTPIQVVQSAFGILTLNGAGGGPAAAFDVNSNYVGFTNALNYGDYVVLWGTAVGPVPGGTDETVQQSPADLSNVPFSAWIGGVPAQVYYHGRSQYPGLDQVILIVPQGVTPGCYVSVVTQSGNIVSNTATLPISASGRTCSEPTVGWSASQYQAIASSGNFAGGFIGVLSGAYDLGGMTSVNNAAGASFFKLTATQFNALPPLIPSLGSCTVLSSTKDSLAASVFGMYAQTLPGAALDAGSLVVTGPAGSAGLPKTSDGYYDTLPTPFQTSLTAGFIPENGGNFMFDNGSGGSGVGKFSASVAMGTGGILKWTNESSISTVNRANGVTVNWSGAGSNTFVVVSGASASDQGPFVSARFACSVPASAGTFTVPPYVLLALPSGGNGLIPHDSLQVSQVTFGQPFSAPQLNAATIMSAFSFLDGVTYQ